MDKVVYTFNKSNELFYYNENKAFIKKIEKVITLNGRNISKLLNDTIKVFSKPQTSETAILMLSEEYEKPTIIKMIDFLVLENIIIDRDNDIYSKSIPIAYISSNKSLFPNYDMNFENNVNTIIDKKIGIIGSKKITDMISNILLETELFKNIMIYYVDASNSISNKITDNININYLSECSTTKSACDLIFENCDFIIASPNAERDNVYKYINQNSLITGTPWCKLSLDSISFEVGPIFIPNQTACYNCCKMLYDKNCSKEEFYFSQVQSNISIENIFSPIYQQSASILCNEVIMFLLLGNSNLISRTFYFNSLNLTSELSNIYKMHYCSECNNL